VVPVKGKWVKKIQCGEKKVTIEKESYNRKRLSQYSLNGEFIKEYPCLTDVKKDGFNIGNVGAVCNGKLKTSGGFIWKYND
jgi:hypothetical protein